jgi:hypothetical protein
MGEDVIEVVYVDVIDKGPVDVKVGVVIVD